MNRESGAAVLGSRTPVREEGSGNINSCRSDLGDRYLASSSSRHTLVPLPQKRAQTYVTSVTSSTGCNILADTHG
jgi:hypothetical protein